MKVLYAATDEALPFLDDWAGGLTGPLRRWHESSAWAPSDDGPILQLYRGERPHRGPSTRLRSWTDSAPEALTFGPALLDRQIPFGRVLVVMWIGGLVEYIVDDAA